MKTWINKIFLLSALSLVLFSCEKDEDRVVLNAGAAPALTASSTDLVLLEEEAGEEAVTLRWSQADYGFDAAVRYTLQLDIKGNNFAAPVESDLGYTMEKTFTVAELNSLLNRLPITGFAENEVDVRLKGEVSEFVDPVFSNVTTLNVTPYLSAPPYATVYLVGDATEFGWDQTQATPMYRSEEDVFVYTYTGPLKAGGLKFLGVKGKWAPQWGNNGSNGIAFRETEQDPDPGTFTIPAAGFYTVNLDLRNNTYSIEPYNAASARTFPSVGIIGAFNGWGDIEPMTKSAFNPHAWTIDYTFAEDTELKFRHAPNWDVNWGAPKGKEAEIFGKTSQGNENLKVTAGTYTILFNDLTGHYVFIEK
ncbi:SusE domain-containing protein [Pontibacter roseus]|uniref:SusE domain-containing protein n=1 Tax=Pontibacter roseus TaxID=336989 RepID=UPI000377325F|nr:SusE domain-containing protein [Pontibacter roseus]